MDGRPPDQPRQARGPVRPDVDLNKISDTVVPKGETTRLEDAVQFSLGVFLSTESALENPLSLAVGVLAGVDAVAPGDFAGWKRSFKRRARRFSVPPLRLGSIVVTRPSQGWGIFRFASVWHNMGSLLRRGPCVSKGYSTSQLFLSTTDLCARSLLPGSGFVADSR